jgi:hypothetical protein
MSSLWEIGYTIGAALDADDRQLGRDAPTPSSLRR